MILGQDGYHGRNLLRRGLAEGVLDGVVLSPRYHTPQEMIKTARELASTGALVVVDPEFQLSLVPDAALLQLSAYPYFTPDLSRRSFSGRTITRIVSSCLRFQTECSCSALLTPSLELASSRDWMSQVVLAMNEEALGQRDFLPDVPLHASLCIGDALLASDDQVDELLDMVTTLDVAGFHIVAARARQDPMWSCPGSNVMFGNLLYVTAILRSNDFDVHLGYSDIGGALAIAAGARGVATGWFKSQRHYCSDAIVASGFGRQPRKAYASAPLMTWVFLEPDLDVIREQGMLGDVLSGNGCDDLIVNREYDAWRREPMVLGLWETMRVLESSLLPRDSGLGLAAERLQEARRLHGLLRAANLPLESDLSNLASWAGAVDYAIGRLEA
ncbi:MAG: hypothetical protein IBX62_06605 [Coriobacteriia bacterium]|nr:hypothetical protein [Coriobacteriia bacterium]